MNYLRLKHLGFLHYGIFLLWLCLCLRYFLNVYDLLLPRDYALGFYNWFLTDTFLSSWDGSNTISLTSYSLSYVSNPVLILSGILNSHTVLLSLDTSLSFSGYWIVDWQFHFEFRQNRPGPFSLVIHRTKAFCARLSRWLSSRMEVISRCSNCGLMDDTCSLIQVLDWHWYLPILSSTIFHHTLFFIGQFLHIVLYPFLYRNLWANFKRDVAIGVLGHEVVLKALLFIRLDELVVVALALGLCVNETVIVLRITQNNTSVGLLRSVLVATAVLSFGLNPSILSLSDKLRYQLWTLLYRRK